MSDEDFTDGEFKINEPQGEIERAKRKKKADEKRSKDFAMRVSLMVNKPNVDVDNVFQVRRDNTDFGGYCGLVPVIPCNKPHCTMCNFVLLNGDEADMLLRCIGDQIVQGIAKEHRYQNIIRQIAKDMERERDANE